MRWEFPTMAGNLKNFCQFEDGWDTMCSCEYKLNYVICI